MIRQKFNEIYRVTKRNYMISQVFTFITGVLIILILYLYNTQNLVKYNNYIYFSYLFMGIVNLVLGFSYSKKIRENTDIIEEILKHHQNRIIRYRKSKAVQGVLNLILIIVLVASFFVNGSKLDVLNDIFFILIIFSYWLFNYNYYNLFKSAEQGMQ